MTFHHTTALAVTLGVLGLIASGAALGQDITGTPTYGSVKLNTGFASPHTLSLSSGGMVDASTIPGGTCRGHIATAPDYLVRYSPGEAGLDIAVTAEADTTLVVYGPDGTWSCDDDGAGYPNPMVSFATPMDGNYLIWVGTYGSATNEPATLSLSEQQRSAGIEVGATPIYGSIALAGGFLPDPREIQITPGGPANATDAVGDHCRGYIATAPDYRVDYTASGTLPLIVSVGSDTDTTLVIQGPDGVWTCDDDTGEGLNPSITFTSPLTGAYQIWIGTYAEQAGGTATLQLSELNSR